MGVVGSWCWEKCMGISEGQRQVWESLLIHSPRSTSPVQHLPPSRETGPPTQLTPHPGYKELSFLAPAYFSASRGGHPFPPLCFPLHPPGHVFQCKPLLFISAVVLSWQSEILFFLFTLFCSSLIRKQLLVISFSLKKK